MQRRLGTRIRKLRLQRGLTQDELADKSGFHRAQIGAFERGEMNMTLGSLLLLAQTFEIKVLDLFKGVEK
ncbi:MAG: helix-turn-helix transcriptional regulator [Acidobacteria bacterium]|nr:helix-turn-helix transcriptional regulator [Acidobacteriota bacterium]